MDGMPEAIKVPEKWLLKEKNVREVVCKHFSDYGWWNKLCPSWWMPEKFLNDHVDELLEKHLKRLLLECLPKPGECRCMSKALVAARALTNGPVSMAAQKSTERELSAAVNLVQDMVDARSPSQKDLANMSEYAVACVKRCESCCILSPRVGMTDCLGVRKKLLGRMRWTIASIGVWKMRRRSIGLTSKHSGSSVGSWMMLSLQRSSNGSRLHS